MTNESEFLEECVNIDPLDVSNEFIKIPANLAYWNERYSVALRKYLLAKVNTKRETARLWLRTKTENSNMRLQDIEAIVESSDAWQAVQLEEIEAEVEKERLKGIVDAIRTKREMVVSLGAQIRAEIGSDPVVRERHMGSRLMENQSKR